MLTCFPTTAVPLQSGGVDVEHTSHAVQCFSRPLAGGCQSWPGRVLHRRRGLYLCPLGCDYPSTLCCHEHHSSRRMSPSLSSVPHPGCPTQGAPCAWLGCQVPTVYSLSPTGQPWVPLGGPRVAVPALPVTSGRAPSLLVGALSLPLSDILMMLNFTCLTRYT